MIFVMMQQAITYIEVYMMVYYFIYYTYYFIVVLWHTHTAEQTSTLDTESTERGQEYGHT